MHQCCNTPAHKLNITFSLWSGMNESTDFTLTELSDCDGCSFLSCIPTIGVFDKWVTWAEGHPVSQWLLLAISTVAGKKTHSESQESNSTQHNFNYLRNSKSCFLIQLNCFMFCLKSVCSVRNGSHASRCVLRCLIHTFHSVFCAVAVIYFTWCFLPCHFGEGWKQVTSWLNISAFIWPICQMHQSRNIAISVVWGLLIGRE
jgi:hypothetical protein